MVSKYHPHLNWQHSAALFGYCQPKLMSVLANQDYRLDSATVNWLSPMSLGSSFVAAFAMLEVVGLLVLPAHEKY